MSRERRERRRRKLEEAERKVPLPPGPMTAGRLAHGILHGLPDDPPENIRVLRAESREHVPKAVADGAAQILMGTMAAVAIEAAIRCPDVSQDVSRVDHADGTFDVALTMRWRPIR